FRPGGGSGRICRGAGRHRRCGPGGGGPGNTARRLRRGCDGNPYRPQGTGGGRPVAPPYPGRVAPRIFALVLVVAFVAGCTGDEEPAPASSVTAPPTTEVPRQEYSYGFEVGQELEYRLDLERRIVIESEGTGQEGVVGDLPGQADAMVIASGLFTYTIGQGPQEGTYLVAIQGDYDRVEVTGTIDGETVEDPGQAAELLSLGPESTTLVVDSAGHVLESVWGGAPEDSSTPGTSGGAAGFMGPILPPDPLGMGETWGETFTEMALGAAEVDG